jgi:hypothetical protein
MQLQQQQQQHQEMSFRQAYQGRVAANAVSTAGIEGSKGLAAPVPAQSSAEDEVDELMDLLGVL